MQAMQRNYQISYFLGQGGARGEGISRRLNFQDAAFACVLAVLFALLVPITEWPDAMDHIALRISEKTIYPPDIFASFSYLQNPLLNGEHSFFADHYKYRPFLGYFLANLERLTFVLALIAWLYLLASKIGDGLLLFCPPLIFSLMAPSQEVVAIAVLLTAAIVAHKYAVCAVLLAALSTVIDRSMAPNGIFLALYVALSPFRSVVQDRRLVFLAGGMLILAASLTTPLDFIGAADNDNKLVFGLTVEDIRNSAGLGQQKFLALAASTMGLFGWLSIRPFPFFIYYPVIIFLFIAGFISSDPPRQGVFIALFVLSYLVLWLIPTLAQARYYPLLTLGFWSMVVSGVRAMKISRAVFYFFVALTTGAGCGVSLLNAL